MTHHLSTIHLRDHCDVCRAAVDLLVLGLPTSDETQLWALLLTHQMNEQERQAHYRRVVDQLRDRRR